MRRTRRPRPLRSVTRACDKMRFASREAAVVAATNKGVLHDSYYRVYLCRKCQGYHLTTQE